MSRVVTAIAHNGENAADSYEEVYRENSNTTLYRRKLHTGITRRKTTRGEIKKKEKLFICIPKTNARFMYTYIKKKK